MIYKNEKEKITCLLWYHLKSGNTFNWWLCPWKCSGEKQTFCYSVIAIFPAIWDKDNEVWRRKCWFGEMNGLYFPYVDLPSKMSLYPKVFFIIFISLYIGVDSAQNLKGRTHYFLRFLWCQINCLLSHAWNVLKPDDSKKKNSFRFNWVLNDKFSICISLASLTLYLTCQFLM